MALNDYAYYNKQTGLVENVVWLETEQLSTFVDYPPEGYALVSIPDGLEGEYSVCGIGWSYIDGQFVEPPAPPEPEQPVVDGAQTL